MPVDEAVPIEEVASLREAERTVRSLATMMGWDNVPPRETLERNLAAIIARTREAR